MRSVLLEFGRRLIGTLLVMLAVALPMPGLLHDVGSLSTSPFRQGNSSDERVARAAFENHSTPATERDASVHVMLFKGKSTGAAWQVELPTAGCADVSCGRTGELEPTVRFWTELNSTIETIILELRYGFYLPTSELQLSLHCKPSVDSAHGCDLRAEPSPYQRIRIDRVEAVLQEDSLEGFWSFSVNEAPAFGVFHPAVIRAGLSVDHEFYGALSWFSGAPAPENYTALAE